MRVNEFAVGARGTCRNCGASLKVSLANTRPHRDEQLEPMASAVSGPEAPTVMAGQADGDHCARCGREFRGEWDQYESTAGMICHVCANRATASGEVQEEVGEVKPVHATYNRDGLDMPEPEPPVNEEFIRKRQREELFQRAVLFAALAMIVLAIIATMVTDISPPEPVEDETVAGTVASGEEAEPESPQLPGWAVYVVYLMLFGFSVLTNLITLFLVLGWAEKLPNDTFPANLIALGVVAIGLTILDLLIDFVSSLPMIGFVWVFLGLILKLYIIYSLYNLTLAEVFAYFLAIILAGALVFVTRMMLLALMGAVLL
jgi:hypothetical protein